MNSTTATHDSRKTKPLYQDMSVQVFAGMALGALIGWLWPQSAEWMRTLGDLFIRLITMFVGLIRGRQPYLIVRNVLYVIFETIIASARPRCYTMKSRRRLEGGRSRLGCWARLTI